MNPRSIESGATPQFFPKTLILVPVLHLTGGVGNYYATLGLDQEPHVQYFVINKGIPQSAAGTLLRLMRNYFLFFLKMVFQRYSQVVVNPSLDPRSFYRDSIFIFLARLTGKKTFVFFRGWLDPFEAEIKTSKLKSFLFKNTYARAGNYIVLGNIFKVKLLSMGVPEKSHFYIETTVADNSALHLLDLEKKYAEYEKEVRILFLARMVREKGIYTAIDSFANYQKAHRDSKKVNLIVAGDGPELEAVKNYVSTRNIEDIEFRGNVSGSSKMHLLAGCHILLFPSDSEGLPNSILEAMLFGMPVITRATGGIPEIIKNEVNGFITESIEPSVFSDFLERLIGQQDLFKKMSTLNHETALQQFTQPEVRGRILHLLNN